MTFNNPDPTCKKVCRFIRGHQSTTCIAWQRMYDKNGNAIGFDPNITKCEIICDTCGRKWYEETNRNGTTITESKFNTK